jgi:UDP-2,3-diacylglucosamine hydrolase
MDRPERARRFASWVRGLDGEVSLVIAGDLCDFWMGARSSETEMMKCEGLEALADFRNRGGALSIMPGNHDHWLCPFYERALGATILADPYDMTVYGIRLHLVHGHLLGARRRWKALMEGNTFFKSFGMLPSALATTLDVLLERKNTAGLDEDERRHLVVFRRYASGLSGKADIVVIGHVHRAVDDAALAPRMVVLGGWQERSSYLKLDETGASFHVLGGEEHELTATGSSLLPLPNESRCTAS